MRVGVINIKSLLIVITQKDLVKKHIVLEEKKRSKRTKGNQKKVIGVYGGRFQPFGPHHLKTYQWLKTKVDESIYNNIRYTKTTTTSIEFF